MPYADMLRFVEVASTELDSEKYFLRTQDTDIDNNLTFIQIRRNHTHYRRPNRAKFRTHSGVFIDICPMFPGSSSRILHYLQTKITRFYKSALWAHMYYDYDESEWNIKRFYYRQLSRIPPKTAYAKFIKYATWFSGKNGNLSYLAHNRNPFAQGWTRPGAFDDPVELEFEGHLFFVPKDYALWLEIGYNADYLRYPELGYRYPKHRAEYVAIGDLHAYGPARPSAEEDHAHES